MRSLSELADVYEQWAIAHEAHADEILAAQDSYPTTASISLGVRTIEGKSCRTEEKSGRTTEARRWED